MTHCGLASSGIFFSKDRREEVIEVEEAPEYAKTPGYNQLKIMSQGEFMSGCPEGGEQGFLFSLYTQLSSEPCACPSCGSIVKRSKSDFFIIYVGSCTLLISGIHLIHCSS